MRFYRPWLALPALLCASAAWAGLTPRLIYQKMAPGVVFISAQDDGSDTVSCGTGSIITGQGQVLTNAHVVYNKEAGKAYGSIKVFLKPAKLTGDLGQDLSQGYDATIQAIDPAMDLALLKLKHAPDSVTTLRLGNSDDVAPGDEAVAIGHPEQGGLWTLTTGVLSAQIKDQGGVAGRDTWQMETSLNRGNSGGPLFDERGYVIGVNTAIARRAADGLAITGINFAIKSSSARHWLAAQGLDLDYGPLPLDDQAIAAAYGLTPPPAAAEAAPAPAAAPTAGAAAAAPASATASTDASTPVPASPTAEAAAPAAASPSAEAAAATQTAQARPPQTFKPDLVQTPRPYTAKEVGAYLKQLTEKRDKAMDELDRSTGGY